MDIVLVVSGVLVIINKNFGCCIDQFYFTSSYICLTSLKYKQTARPEIAEIRITEVRSISSSSAKLEFLDATVNFTPGKT